MYQYKGQGRIFLKYETFFVPICFKISKENKLKQKSYKDLSIQRIEELMN